MLGISPSKYVAAEGRIAQTPAIRRRLGELVNSTRTGSSGSVLLRKGMPTQRPFAERRGEQGWAWLDGSIRKGNRGHLLA